jgi:copper chaperone CopZ
MEDAIKKLDGVNDASVSFMTQKMMIDADDEKFDQVLQEAIKCISNVEPDCKVVLK